VDASAVVYEWGPFVVTQASSRTPGLGVLFREPRHEGTVLRTASRLEKERLLDHLLEETQGEPLDEASQEFELISFLRLELGEAAR
jgi:hypothetical protein